jgi:hypothetical protein
LISCLGADQWTQSLKRKKKKFFLKVKYAAYSGFSKLRNCVIRKRRFHGAAEEGGEFEKELQYTLENPAL